MRGRVWGRVCVWGSEDRWFMEAEKIISEWINYESVAGQNKKIEQ